MTRCAPREIREHGSFRYGDQVATADETDDAFAGCSTRGARDGSRLPLGGTNMELKRKRCLLAAVGLILIPAAARATDEEELLKQRSRAWAEAAAGGDLEAILAFWADDAVVMPPGRPPLEGKAAIREYVAESLRVPGFSITWEPVRATVAASGDLGYLVERNRVTVPGEAGEQLTISGQGITVWRRRDGQWLCVLDIWNELPPPAPAP